MKESCETCKYWNQYQKTDQGMCRRLPPMSSATMKRWADTFDNEWCGEYKPKTARLYLAKYLK